MTAIIIMISAIILAIVAPFLALHREYEDGVCGKIALFCLTVAGMGKVALWVDGSYYLIAPTPISTFIWVGSAIFLLRHLFRFMLFTRRNDRADQVPS